MTAVDNTIQRRLKFKITSKGIRDVSDKLCENIVRAIVHNEHGKEQRVTDVRNKMPKVKFSVKACVSTNSDKRRTEVPLDSQREKRQKIDHNVKQYCGNILKILMMHRVGCYFSEPVDPVKLLIPDYFSIIAKPMDLGTIKHKLETNLNYGAEAFAADVRLTFSNAMLYNPPGNCFHKFAKELDEIFNRRWKVFQAKLKSEKKKVEQEKLCGKMGEIDRISSQTAEENGLVKTEMPINVDTPQAYLVCQRPMLLEEKQKLRSEILEISRRKMTKDILSSLQEFGFSDLSEERLDSFFVSAEVEALWKLKAVIKCFLDARGKKGEPAKMGQSEPSLSCKAVRKEKRSQSSFASACHKQLIDSTVTKCSCGSRLCHCRPRMSSFQASSNDMISQISSEPDHCGHPTFVSDCRKMQQLASDASKVTPDLNVLGVIEGSSPRFSTPETAVSDEAWLSPNIQLSPKKALRAAMLKSRFADTILRATHHSRLEHGEKSDPLMIQQEKETLIKRQLEEKTRIEAEIKAVEDASRMRREREREAARMALQKMEKTVEINESQEILTYIDMLSHDSLSDFPDGDGPEGLIGATQGSRSSGNLLERLGLYIKADYQEEDEEGILSGEEGEILSYLPSSTCLRI